MAWTRPRTWIAGETPTASLFNEQFKANFDYMRAIRELPIDLYGNPRNRLSVAFGAVQSQWYDLPDAAQVFEFRVGPASEPAAPGNIFEIDVHHSIYDSGTGSVRVYSVGDAAAVTNSQIDFTTSGRSSSAGLSLAMGGVFRFQRRVTSATGAIAVWALRIRPH